MNAKKLINGSILGLTAAALASMSGCAKRVDAYNVDAPVISGMKAEFVKAGDTAVIYGSSLSGAKVEFDTQFYDETVEGDVVSKLSNDSVLYVVVPRSAWMGKIKVSNEVGSTTSSFLFKDRRNIIVDFDRCHQTWGGYFPYDDNKQLITGVNGETFVAPLPNPCDSLYSLLYGTYDTPWKMDNTLLLQYMANADEGGRGYVSVAGLPFVNNKLEDLVLKFECNIDKRTPFKGVHAEIFFGPRDGKDKHGRSESVICFWDPSTDLEGYSVAGGNKGKDLSNGFYTDGWETITIPLTEFKHTSETDEVLHNLRIDLPTAVNFSFMIFGNVEKPVNVQMCVDNFRIVPKSE